MKTGTIFLTASLWLALAVGRAQAAPGEVDLTFDPGSAVNSQVRATAIQGDGKILIAGFFTTVHGAARTGIARLNADGSLDNSFQVTLANPVTTYYDAPVVRALLVKNDGGILIAGTFTSVNGVAQTNLALLKPDGALDNSFASGLANQSDLVSAIRQQPDDKILIAGSFNFVSGVARTNLARLNPNGTLDGSFLNGLIGPDRTVQSMALQSDGRILIGGDFISVNGTAQMKVARLQSDGSLDDTFPSGLTDSLDFVIAVAVQTDGKVLITGRFSAIEGVPQTNFARLNIDGSLDESFPGNLKLGHWAGASLALQPDGKILLAGGFTAVNGSPCTNLARLNADGSWDEAFTARLPDLQSDEAGVSAFALQSDGKIIVSGGLFVVVAPGRYLCRLNADGTVDTSFNSGPTGPDSEILQLATTSAGQTVIAGRFHSVSGQPRGHLARLLPDGSLDQTFLNARAGADADVWAVAVQKDGRTLIGGEFHSVNGVARAGLARLNPDGSLDSFADQLGGYVYALGLQPDGKIIVGGSGRANNLARLYPDGSTDASFLSNLIGYSGVQCLTLQSDGKILIGGWFSTVNGSTRNRIARLNANGSIDNSFQNGMAGADQAIWSLAVQSDGKVLIGGWFNTINGVARARLARLNTNGSLDGSFLTGMAGPDGGAMSLAVQSDGKILVGGGFRLFNGIPAPGLVRINPSGSLDPSFVASTTAAMPDSGSVNVITFQSDAKILIGGDMTLVNQTPRSYVARLMGEYGPPIIQTQPLSQTVEQGSSAYFSVEASAVSALTYQWFFNSTQALGEPTTNSFLELANVQSLDTGAYTVIVTNISGSATSAPAMLSVIPPVPRRIVPGVKLSGDPGSLLHLEYLSSLRPPWIWQKLADITLAGTYDYYFDLLDPLVPERFMRIRQVSPVVTLPDCSIDLVPALTLTGQVGDSLRVDYINKLGPTDAWVTLDTVTLTNTSQLYFDVSAPRQPVRLYRLVPVP